MNRASESLVGSIERVTFHNANNGLADPEPVVNGQRILTAYSGYFTVARKAMAMQV